MYVPCSNMDPIMLETIWIYQRNFRNKILYNLLFKTRPQISIFISICLMSYSRKDLTLGQLFQQRKFSVFDLMDPIFEKSLILGRS